MNLTLETVNQMLADGWRPTRGRCFIHLDAPPTMSGLLHIPELSQEVQLTDAVWRGTILALSPRWERAKDLEEKFGESAGRVMVNIDEIDNRPLAAGDRVWLLLRAEDMDRSVIITDNTRIVAVITR